MPVTIELIREGRAVVQIYQDPISATQMFDLGQLMDTDILPVAKDKMPVIADFRQVSDLPRTMLTSGSRMLKRAHPNTGLIIMVVNKGFVQILGEVFTRLASKQSVLVLTSMDEALEKVDSILAPSKVVTS